MRIYQLTCVLGPELSGAKQKSVQTFIEKLSQELKGKIVRFDDWGKRQLAGKIEKFDSGIFLDFELELNSEVLAKFDKSLREKEEIIRYLLVRKD